jgi:tight adherence protein B
VIPAFSILIAFTVALFAAGVFIERSGAAGRALADRLQRLGRSHAEDLPRVDIRRDRRYSSIPWMDRILRSVNVGDRLEMMLYQAGLTMRAGVLVVLSAAAAMGGYLIGAIIFHRVLPGLLFLVLLAPAPLLYVLYRKGRRMKAFREAFPDSLDLLVSGLRAGLSFSAAMQIVSEESPDPVRSEFAITVEEQALGLDLREALLNLTRRVEVLDLRFFVTAVLLQRETGGNLAEVLSNSAALIRDRFRVLGDIQTFTAQGKLTAVILVLLPIGVGLLTYSMSPEYFKPMLEEASGRAAIWFAGGLQLLGCFVIYRIDNIKV